MKQLLLGFFLLLCLAAAAQQIKADRIANNLIGPVKSTSTAYFDAEEKFGELVKDFRRAFEVDEYNRGGLLTFSNHEFRGSVTKTSYKYNEAGDLVEKKENDYGDETATTEKIIYSPDGKETEVNTYNDKGTLQTKRKNKYNEHSVLVSSSLYNGDGSLKEKNVFTCNDKKQVSEKETYDAKENLREVAMYEYDKDGRVILEIEMEKGGNGVETYTRNYTYNSKGQMVAKERTLIDGRLWKEKYEYDEFGNMTKTYTDEKNYEINEFTYDSRSNWIKQVRTWNSSGTIRKYIIERTVKYY